MEGYGKMKIPILIPGFRSGILWKKVIATIYYALTVYLFIQSWSLLTFFIAFPFAVFSLIDIIKASILGLDAGNSKYVFILSNIALFTGAIDVFRSFFNMNPNKKRLPIAQKIPYNALKVHFLNIGQGDCILIQQGPNAMLIDAGYWINGRSIVKYLKNKGVEKLDYIIVTHPHPDHIGGMPRVLRHIPVDRMILPMVKYPIQKHREKVEKLLSISNDGNTEIIPACPNTIYKFGKGYFSVLSPNGDRYDRLNNYSIVTKLVFGHTAFLFAGDAEMYLEHEMIKEGFNLKSDVLKVGHHGSYTSTSKEFLQAVSPKYAVISVGRKSLYGHPDKSTLNKLEDIGAVLYRTDKRGTVVAISDGSNVVFDTRPCTYPNGRKKLTPYRRKYKLLSKNKKVNQL